MYSYQLDDITTIFTPEKGYSYDEEDTHSDFLGMRTFIHCPECHRADAFISHNRNAAGVRRYICKGRTTFLNSSRGNGCKHVITSYEMFALTVKTGVGLHELQKTDMHTLPPELQSSNAYYLGIIHTLKAALQELFNETQRPLTPPPPPVYVSTETQTDAPIYHSVEIQTAAPTTCSVGIQTDAPLLSTCSVETQTDALPPPAPLLARAAPLSSPPMAKRAKKTTASTSTSTSTPLDFAKAAKRAPPAPPQQPKTADALQSLMAQPPPKKSVAPVALYISGLQRGRISLIKYYLRVLGFDVRSSSLLNISFLGKSTCELLLAPHSLQSYIDKFLQIGHPSLRILDGFNPVSAADPSASPALQASLRQKFAARASSIINRNGTLPSVRKYFSTLLEKHNLTCHPPLSTSDTDSMS